MHFRSARHPLVAAAAFLLAGACSSSPSPIVSASGSTDTSGSTGSPVATTGSSGMTATSGGTTVTSGPATTSPSGTAAGSSGTTTSASGATGESASGDATGTDAGAATTEGGTTGVDGGVDDGDPPPPRPINITPGGGCNCVVDYNGQPLFVDTRKPIIGKLILVLGGICGGTGGGGIEAFYKQYGFHTFAPATQTCVNSAPQMYKDIIAKTPDDPEANRQVGDARMDLWDGMGRVNWVTVAPGTAIVDETVAALKLGMMKDPGADWGYFLNTDGTLRTTDVYVVGYSWGSQTWAMIASYVRFGRVITTSGPQAEGFPNATWITVPSATPEDRKFMAVGFVSDYPSTTPIDIAPNTVTSMIDTTTKAGWIGPPMNVHPGDTGPFKGGQFPMVGSNPHSPGGHTVFCTNDPMDGWIPICKYLFNVQ